MHLTSLSTKSSEFFRQSQIAPCPTWVWPEAAGMNLGSRGEDGTLTLGRKAGTVVATGNPRPDPLEACAASLSSLASWQVFSTRFLMANCLNGIEDWLLVATLGGDC